MEIMSVINRLIEHIRELIADAVKEALSPLAPYLKMLATGTIYVIIAGSLMYLVLLFAGAGLFLVLSEYYKMAYAAFWTSGAYLALSVILMIVGYSKIRKPR